jgi:hypothetical protein
MLTRTLNPRRTVRKAVNLTVVTATTLCLVASVTSCGGGGSTGGRVIAEVAGQPITESTLHHWTAAFINSDYRVVDARKAPPGLASAPPNYKACLAAATKIAATSQYLKRRPTTAELNVDCRQLYHAASLQAVSYLISSLWAVGQLAELGEKVTEQDLQRQLQQVAAKQYPTQQALHKYVDERGWTTTDLRNTLRQELLSARVVNGLKAKANKTGGGEHAFVELIQKRNATWTAKTNCRPAYLVWQCQEYKGEEPGSPSAAVVLERIGLPR